MDRDVHLAQPDEPAYSAARQPGDGITQSRLPRLAGHFPQEPPVGGRASKALRVTVIQLVDSPSDLNFHVIPSGTERGSSGRPTTHRGTCGISLVGISRSPVRSANLPGNALWRADSRSQIGTRSRAGFLIVHVYRHPVSCLRLPSPGGFSRISMPIVSKPAPGLA